MRIFIILFFLTSLLFGAQILSTNFKTEPNSATLTLTFDTPYHGSLRKSYQDGYIILKLSNLEIESAYVKDNLSSLVKNITVQSQNGETMIIANALKGVNLAASRSKDAFAMRLQFSKPAATSNTITEKHSLSHFTFRDYLLMLLLALGGGALLFWLLRKKSNAETSAAKEKSVKPAEVTIKAQSKEAAEPVSGIKDDHHDIEQDVAVQPDETSRVQIRFQKKIDQHNHALLAYADHEYPVIIGEQNSFLNHRNLTDSPLSSESFDTLVDEYLTQVENRNKAIENTREEINSNEALESYKEKASRENTLF